MASLEHKFFGLICIGNHMNESAIWEVKPSVCQVQFPQAMRSHLINRLDPLFF